MNDSDNMNEAVAEMTGDDYAGSKIMMEDVEEVAKKYGVESEDLAKAILQNGIDDGWLADEFFGW